MSNSENGKGNGRDAQLALSGLRRQLAQLPARKRMDAMVEAPQARALVRSLPAEDLYITIQEVGLEDATELVHLVSPTQFRTFVDLAGWKRDRVEPHTVLTWLRAARGEEPEEFLRKVRGMDMEVLEYLLHEFIVVHDLEENPDVNPEGVTMETPEGRYLVEFKAEGVELAGLRSLITDLIAENPFEAVRLFEAVRWEVPSELEETGYQFRSARLQDMGFPTLEDAMSLFSRVDVPPAPAASTSAALATERGRVDWLTEAFAGLTEVERDNLEGEVRDVSNAALVAELADPGDLDALRGVGEMVRDYLSLGFEYLAGGDATRATDVVHEHPLKRIFQLGFTLTLRLKYRADRLMKAPLAVLDETPLTFPEEAAALAALRLKRPRRALRVEGAEPVWFRSLREVAASEAVLTRAEAQVEVMRAVLGGAEAPAREALARFGVGLGALGVDRLFAATLAMAVLDGRVDPRPVPSGRVVELCERLFEGDAQAPRLRTTAAERAYGALHPLVKPEAHAELRRMVAVTLSKMLEEIAVPYFQEGRVDPTLSVVLPMETGAAV